MRIGWYASARTSIQPRADLCTFKKDVFDDFVFPKYGKCMYSLMNFVVTRPPKKTPKDFWKLEAIILATVLETKASVSAV